MVAFRSSLDPLSVAARCPDGINTNQWGYPTLPGYLLRMLSETRTHCTRVDAVSLLLTSAFLLINSPAYPVLLPIQWGVQSDATKSDGEEQWGWWLSSDWMFQLLIVMPWCSESCSADSTIYFNQDRGEMGVDVSPRFIVAEECTLSLCLPLSLSLSLFFHTNTHTDTHAQVEWEWRRGCCG